MSSRQDEKATPSTTTADLAGLRCPECDYDLTGAREARCPECGTGFDPGGLRAFQKWNNLRYRKTAICLLMMTSAVLVLQFVAMNWVRTTPSRPHSTTQTFWESVMRLNVAMNRSMPCFALPFLMLVSLIVTFKATGLGAHKSALIAFLAAILCGFGLLQLWAMAVWSV